MKRVVDADVFKRTAAEATPAPSRWYRDRRRPTAPFARRYDAGAIAQLLWASGRSPTGLPRCNRAPTVAHQAVGADLLAPTLIALPGETALTSPWHYYNGSSADSFYGLHAG